MNKVTYLIFLILISCGKSSPKHVESIKEKAQKAAEYELIGNEEKIALLATIKKTSSDSISMILKDYFINTDSCQEISDYQKGITITAHKFHISEAKVAGIVFSFKYELLTNEEIYEQEQDRTSDYDLNSR